MVHGQIHQQLSNNSAARASFTVGIKACPKEPTSLDPRQWGRQMGRASNPVHSSTKQDRLTQGTNSSGPKPLGLRIALGLDRYKPKPHCRVGCKSAPPLACYGRWVRAEPRALRKTKDTPLIVVDCVYGCKGVVGGSGDWGSEGVVFEGAGDGSGSGRCVGLVRETAWDGGAFSFSSSFNILNVYSTQNKSGCSTFINYPMYIVTTQGGLTPPWSQYIYIIPPYSLPSTHSCLPSLHPSNSRFGVNIL